MQLSIRHSSTRTDLPYSLISNKYVVRTQVSTQISVTYRWNQEQCSNNCACNVKTFQSKAECAWRLFRVANVKRWCTNKLYLIFWFFPNFWEPCFVDKILYYLSTKLAVNTAIYLREFPKWNNKDTKSKFAVDLNVYNTECKRCWK